MSKISLPLLCLLTALIGTALPDLMIGAAVSAAWAGDNDGDGGSDGGGDDGGDDGGSDDGGSDDGGSDDGDSDDGGADDDGSDDGGTGGESSGGASGGRDRESGKDRVDLGALFAADGMRRIGRDGATEVIRDGRFQRLSPRGKLLEDRPARAADKREILRLRAGETFIRVDRTRKRLQLTDSGGWTEIIEGGRYELRDPNGNRVTRRPVRPGDTQRFREALDLR